MAGFFLVGCSWIHNVTAPDQPKAGVAKTKTSVVQTTQAQTEIKVGDVVFNEHYGDPNKPEYGFFATKFWQGQPQVMCYNKACRDDIPAALLLAMMDDLNARQPIGYERSDENFNRREWSLTDYGAKPVTTAKTIVVQSMVAEKTVVVQKPALEKRVVVLEKRNLYEDVEARIKALPGNPFDGSIKELQIAEGLRADGIPGKKTLWALRRAEALPRVQALGYNSFYDFQEVWQIKKDNLWGNQSEATLKKAEEINKKYSIAIKGRLGMEVKDFQCYYVLTQRGSVDPGTKTQADKVLGLLNKTRSKEIVDTAPKPDCANAATVK